MPQLRNRLKVGGGRKIEFACPECHAGLLTDPDRPVNGTCPACGGWISSPKGLQPMPVVTGPRAVERRTRPRFHAHGERTIPGHFRCSISPDLIIDAGYEQRKEMRGFYRFLGVMLAAVGLCVAMIFLMRH